MLKLSAALLQRISGGGLALGHSPRGFNGLIGPRLALGHSPSMQLPLARQCGAKLADSALGFGEPRHQSISGSVSLHLP